MPSKRSTCKPVPSKPDGEEKELHQRMPSIPAERYDLRVLSAIRQIIREVDTYSKRLASEYGITVPQLVCLAKIDERGPLALKDLAEQAFLSSSTVVGIVDRLERQELVQRERSVRDRRLVRVYLTEKGKELLANSPSPLHEALAAALERLPDPEKATIALSLEKVVTLMGPGSGKAAPILEAGSDLEAPRE